MPPKKRTNKDALDVLEERILNLERRVQQLENQKTPTIPTYDNTNLPTNSIEGQIAIIENV